MTTRGYVVIGHFGPTSLTRATKHRWRGLPILMFTDAAMLFATRAEAQKALRRTKAYSRANNMRWESFANWRVVRVAAPAATTEGK